MASILDKRYKLKDVSTVEILLLFATFWVLLIFFSGSSFFDFSIKQSPLIKFFQKSPQLYNLVYLLSFILSILGVIAYLFRFNIIRKAWILSEMVFWLALTIVYAFILPYSLVIGFTALFASSCWFAYREMKNEESLVKL